MRALLVALFIAALAACLYVELTIGPCWRAEFRYQSAICPEGSH